MTWQLGTIGRFYECGENTIVYFDPASGDTHLISTFAAYLMRRLAGVAGSMTTSEIISLVTDDIDPEDLDELSRIIPEILVELSNLDIIERT